MTHGRFSPERDEFITLGDDIQLAIDLIKSAKRRKYESEDYWIKRSSEFSQKINELEKTMVAYIQGSLIYYSLVKIVYKYISIYQDG
jgi:hypothetical protein